MCVCVCVCVCIYNKYVKFGNRLPIHVFKYSNSMLIDAYRFQVREKSVFKLKGPSELEVNLELPIHCYFKIAYFFGCVSGEGAVIDCRKVQD